MANQFLAKHDLHRDGRQSFFDVQISERLELGSILFLQSSTSDSGFFRRNRNNNFDDDIRSRFGLSNLHFRTQINPSNFHFRTRINLFKLQSLSGARFDLFNYRLTIDTRFDFFDRRLSLKRRFVVFNLRKNDDLVFPLFGVDGDGLLGGLGLLLEEDRT
jgi:hypothetical protein